MKTFKQYLLEANEIVPFDYKDKQPKVNDHRDHVLGQFLNFVQNELPHAGEDDFDSNGEFKKHLSGSISTILGDDPQHFGALHKQLTTDEEGKPKEADLFDALQHITKQTSDTLLKAKGKNISDSDYDSIIASRKTIQDHLDKQADANIKRAKKPNMDSLLDIKI
mgnify:CR=1 FL=1|jgi:hypothetical protein|tara:strand:- start:841 stop:1335 length:495 start_codon:yes stop_codon:yes gene_type:complete